MWERGRDGQTKKEQSALYMYMYFSSINAFLWLFTHFQLAHKLLIHLQQGAFETIVVKDEIYCS